MSWHRGAPGSSRLIWPWPIVFLIGLTLPAQPSTATAPSPSLRHGGAHVVTFTSGNTQLRFDLEKTNELHRLSQAAAARLESITQREKVRRDARRALLAQGAPAEMPRTSLKAFHAEPPVGEAGKDRRALELLRDLCGAAASESAPQVRRATLEQIEELVGAIHYNQVPPVPVSIGFLRPPVVFLDYSYNPVGHGQTPASNLERVDGSDLSLLDPLPSTIWERPSDIASQELFYGFGRTQLPDFAGRIWDYARPKTSYGWSPGCEVIGGGLRLKMKFHEVLSEPLTARFFAALGYHVDPTDYAAGLKLRYDRRFFREFHLRKPVQTEIRLLWLLPVYRIHLQKHYDPFRFVETAVFKDGTQVSGSRLKTLLLRHTDHKYPEEDPSNFRIEVEQALDYLVMAPANVQVRNEEDGETLGPWSFAGLGHEDRRELRGACLLAAWLNWFDSRFENTRLRVTHTANGPELRHVFTDLGGGLGKATGALTRSSESPNDFPWTFIRPPKFQGKGRMTIPFRVEHYQPNQDTLAFQKMTLDDARWMGRLIGRLTESQLLEALLGSGFDSARARLYLEKLVSRRDDMIRDLGLEPELGSLRPQGVNRDLTYDPRVTAPLRIRTRDGHEHVAPLGKWKVVAGSLHPQSPGD